MGPILCELALAVFGTAAPVPKGADALAPPPRAIVRFEGLRFVENPMRRFDRAVSYGTFDDRGPVDGSFVALPRDLIHVTRDSEKGTFYGVSRHNVYVVPAGATDRRELIELKLPNTVTELSWSCGIAFDTKRARVIVCSLGGKGHLYAFTPKTEKWAELTDLDNRDLHALTYSERADALYGVHLSWREDAPAIVKYDPVTGKLLEEISLKGSVYPQGRGENGEDHNTPAQMAARGNHLLIYKRDRLYRFDLTSQKLTQEWPK